MKEKFFVLLIIVVALTIILLLNYIINPIDKKMKREFKNLCEKSNLTYSEIGEGSELGSCYKQKENNIREYYWWTSDRMAMRPIER